MSADMGTGPDSLVSVVIDGVVYTDHASTTARTDSPFQAFTNSLTAMLAALGLLPSRSADSGSRVPGSGTASPEPGIQGAL